MVRDRNGGRVGSVTHAFEVPRLDGFRVSTPILSDSVQAAAGGTSTRPVLVARRTFAAGSTLFCQFAAYGALRDGRTAAPSVSSSWKLIRASDGALVRATEPRAMAPAPDGSLLRLYGISLAGIQPGEYELVLDVRDELAVRRVEVREPFVVSSALGVSG